MDRFSWRAKGIQSPPPAAGGPTDTLIFIIPVAAAIAPSAPTDLAWRVIGLLNLYRLLVPLVLISVQALAGPQWALLAIHPRLFLSACIACLTAAVLLILARRLEWSSLRFVALINASVDAA